MKFIIENWLFMLIVACALAVYYWYYYRLINSEKINNLYKDSKNIKNNYIFAQNENESEMLSHDHLDASLHSPNAEKENWKDVLKELNETSSDIISKNRLHKTLDDLGVNPADDVN